APWNLRDSADQNRRFAVRLLVDSSSGQNVMFQSAELEAFRAEESVRTTLIIVRVTPPSDSSETNRSIFRTIDNWSPDTDVMRPVTWSLPLSEETAGQTSDTGKTTGTDNTAGPVDVAGRR
ncbi:MAG: hypothetical protein KDA89_05015, partial [Planctomycetaceae bacterium]|nr:hypothetical protein [Planctomycetaceae bacterium]